MGTTRLVAMIAIATVLSGCTLALPGSPDVATVGRAGGTFEFDEGRVTLIIPRDAVFRSAAVDVRRLPDDSANGTVVAYELRPPGLRFGTPARIAVIVPHEEANASAVPVLVPFLRGDEGHVVPANTTVRGTPGAVRLEADLDALGHLVVAGGGLWSLARAEQPEVPVGGPNQTILVGLAARVPAGVVAEDEFAALAADVDYADRVIGPLVRDGPLARLQASSAAALRAGSAAAAAAAANGYACQAAAERVAVHHLLTILAGHAFPGGGPSRVVEGIEAARIVVDVSTGAFRCAGANG